jgi:hypothetical protein
MKPPPVVIYGECTALPPPGTAPLPHRVRVFPRPSMRSSSGLSLSLSVLFSVSKFSNTRWQVSQVSILVTKLHSLREIL